MKTITLPKDDIYDIDENTTLTLVNPTQECIDKLVNNNPNGLELKSLDIIYDLDEDTEIIFKGNKRYLIKTEDTKITINGGKITLNNVEFYYKSGIIVDSFIGAFKNSYVDAPINISREVQVERSYDPNIECSYLTFNESLYEDVEGSSYLVQLRITSPNNYVYISEKLCNILKNKKNIKILIHPDIKILAYNLEWIDNINKAESGTHIIEQEDLEYIINGDTVIENKNVYETDYDFITSKTFNNCIFKIEMNIHREYPINNTYKCNYNQLLNINEIENKTIIMDNDSFNKVLLNPDFVKYNVYNLHRADNYKIINELTKQVLTHSDFEKSDYIWEYRYKTKLPEHIKTTLYNFASQNYYKHIIKSFPFDTYDYNLDPDFIKSKKEILDSPSWMYSEEEKQRRIESLIENYKSKSYPTYNSYKKDYVTELYQEIESKISECRQAIENYENNNSATTLDDIAIKKWMIVEKKIEIVKLNQQKYTLYKFDNLTEQQIQLLPLLDIENKDLKIYFNDGNYRVEIDDFSLDLSKSKINYVFDSIMHGGSPVIAPSDYNGKTWSIDVSLVFPQLYSNRHNVSLNKISEIFGYNPLIINTFDIAKLEEIYKAKNYEFSNINDLTIKVNKKKDFIFNNINNIKIINNCFDVYNVVQALTLNINSDNEVNLEIIGLNRSLNPNGIGYANVKINSTNYINLTAKNSNINANKINNLSIFNATVNCDDILNISKIEGLDCRVTTFLNPRNIKTNFQNETHPELNGLNYYDIPCDIELKIKPEDSSLFENIVFNIYNNCNNFIGIIDLDKYNFFIDNIEDFKYVHHNFRLTLNNTTGYTPIKLTEKQFNSLENEDMSYDEYISKYDELLEHNKNIKNHEIKLYLKDETRNMISLNDSGSKVGGYVKVKKILRVNDEYDRKDLKIIDDYNLQDNEYIEIFNKRYDNIFYKQIEFTPECFEPFTDELGNIKLPFNATTNNIAIIYEKKLMPRYNIRRAVNCSLSIDGLVNSDYKDADIRDCEIYTYYGYDLRHQTKMKNIIVTSNITINYNRFFKDSLLMFDNVDGLCVCGDYRIGAVKLPCGCNYGGFIDAKNTKFMLPSKLSTKPLYSGTQILYDVYKNSFSFNYNYPRSSDFRSIPNIGAGFININSSKIPNDLNESNFYNFITNKNNYNNYNYKDKEFSLDLYFSGFEIDRTGMSPNYWENYDEGQKRRLKLAEKLDELGSYYGLKKYETIARIDKYNWLVKHIIDEKIEIKPIITEFGIQHNPNRQIQTNPLNFINGLTKCDDKNCLEFLNFKDFISNLSYNRVGSFNETYRFNNKKYKIYRNKP